MKHRLALLAALGGAIVAAVTPGGAQTIVAGELLLIDEGNTVTVRGDGTGDFASPFAIRYVRIDNGRFVLEDGARVLTEATATFSLPRSEIVLTGEGTRWDNTGDFYIGRARAASLTIARGAELVVHGNLFGTYETDSELTVNIGAAAGEVPVAPGGLHIAGAFSLQNPLGSPGGLATITLNHTGSIETAWRITGRTLVLQHLAGETKFTAPIIAVGGLFLRGGHMHLQAPTSLDLIEVGGGGSGVAQLTLTSQLNGGLIRVAPNAADRVEITIGAGGDLTSPGTMELGRDGHAQFDFRGALCLRSGT